MNKNIKFWREKNALSLSDRFEIREPSKIELSKLIIQKFKEKANMFAAVYDFEKTAKYLHSKAKKEQNPEKKEQLLILAQEVEQTQSVPFELQQMILERVLIDFFQLERDFMKANQIKPGMTYKRGSMFIYERKFNPSKTHADICTQIASLDPKNESDNIPALARIHKSVEEIALNFQMDIKDLKKQQADIELNEGSFLKGKIIDTSKPKTSDEPQPI